MELVQIVFHPPWFRTLPHTSVPAKWCKGFFLHSILFVLSALKACFADASNLGFFVQNLSWRCFGSWLSSDQVFFFVLFFWFFFLAGSHRLKQLLSFAIGGLLGNVFLHLLPEAWAYTCSATTGMRVLCAWKQFVLCLLLHFLSLVYLEGPRPASLGQPKNWSRLVSFFKQYIKANA